MQNVAAEIQIKNNDPKNVLRLKHTLFFSLSLAHAQLHTHTSPLNSSSNGGLSNQVMAVDRRKKGRKKTRILACQWATNHSQMKAKHSYGNSQKQWTNCYTGHNYKIAWNECSQLLFELEFSRQWKRL